MAIIQTDICYLRPNHAKVYREIMTQKYKLLSRLSIQEWAVQFFFCFEWDVGGGGKTERLRYVSGKVLYATSKKSKLS